MKTRDGVRRELEGVAGIKSDSIGNFGATVAALLSDLVGGLHHWNTRQLKAVDWTNSHYIVITASMSLATWDNNALTRLVFLAHDYCVRVDVQPASPQSIRLLFHPRQRNGSPMERHPTIEEAVEDWRKRNPIIVADGAAGGM